MTAPIIAAEVTLEYTSMVGISGDNMAPNAASWGVIDRDPLWSRVLEGGAK